MTKEECAKMCEDNGCSQECKDNCMSQYDENGKYIDARSKLTLQL